ncbi:hypothetical protein CONLIGDRAFT_403080 [Coniochaeta ligniaria NRRL 30616]|uniref:C2H2-type domain-containing protein n=1 Tax=Coniochaeta ligniaria NRRL 30616 TaxID=1408157 RepID=A0A1J7J6T3_9PEZI|nr:hypothetical protein CONLIGDRAFT_403080 [Coniochaeta ligniaria NRRL 30616]
MEPSSKRRRLAPRVPDAPTQPASNSTQPLATQALAPEQAQQQFQPAEHAAPAILPERHDFESFARHLQDAAMLIYRQTQKCPYSSVSVLLLRWEEDTSVENDLVALEKVFRERYNYHTDKWQIPTVPNPSIKLGVQMASFLENARPDHLLIVYYAGHGYVGPDNQLYWACNTREDAAKLKWDGVRCLFEDAQSDILLLLDTCVVKDAPLAGSHGLKQAIAAYSPEQSDRDAGSRSFTASLADSLHKLSTTGRPFSAQRLYEDILVQRHQDAAQPRLTNGSTKPNPQERLPVSFTMTPGKGQSLSLAPLPSKPSSDQPYQPAEVDGQSPRLSREDQLINPGTVVDLTFDEARVLVCTTFVGDASLDMTFFNQWLHNTPPVASKIAVEGMFIGPPTMLLISMPHSIWNVVQHDKVCCFLGYISSHNMIHLYKHLVGSTPINAASSKEVEDGRILLEAREAAAASPSIIRREPTGIYPALQPDTPVHTETNGREPLPIGLTPDKAGLPHGSPNTAGKDEVEDSAEMQEAAEQLKALSHVRHLSDGTPSKLEHQGTKLGDSIDVAHDMDSAQDSGADEIHYSVDYGTPASASKPKPRKPLTQKPMPKPETRCTLCTHAPFKDSSSLRKHIAAAHTRPFPCAFAFAGCTSTFGSKNEWKRHIASQHLCLTYYRCSSCPQSTAEGKGNEFNRKDLFTQHLRRMHAPFAIKKSIAKGDSRIQAEWDSHVKEMQQSCLVIRRQPPMKSACPKGDCQTVFEGVGSWDEWTEHVGRHMEKGEAQRMGVDRMLAQWALDESIIERKEDGEYKLCSQANGGGDRDSSQLQHQSTNGSGSNNHSFISDAGRQDDDDPSITVATSAPVSEKMDLD